MKGFSKIALRLIKFYSKYLNHLDVTPSMRMTRKRIVKNRIPLVLIVQKEYKFKRNCNPSKVGTRNYQFDTRLNLSSPHINNNMYIRAPKNRKRVKKPSRRSRK